MAYSKVPLLIDHLDDHERLRVVGNKEAKCKLGESPLWCNRRNRLFWVDITESPDLEVRVADVYVPGGGEWKQESLRQEGFHVRLNDGRVDRNGRLVIGGINESFGDFQDGWKAVQPCFRVEMMRRTESNINGTTLSASTLQSIPLAKISNSICFSLDGSTMFYSDTPTKTICMSPYGDAVSGVGGEVVIQTDHQPDGSVIDASQGLWNAEYEGGTVKRYELSTFTPEASCCNPVRAQNSNIPPAVVTATATMTIAVPVKQTTCPCIGGPNGDVLFITTASNFFSEARYIEEPLAGHLFMFQLPTSEHYVAENLFDDSDMC